MRISNGTENGFTLAEVLITLGIIGVVAAMTIPTLIANTRSKQYSSQLKKAISTLSQSARMSQSLYDFDYGGVTESCSSNPQSDNPEGIQSICAMLNGTLKGITVKKYSDFNNGSGITYNINSSWIKANSTLTNNTPIYILSDGTIIGINPNLGQFNSCSLDIGKNITNDGTGGGVAYCTGFIDVNGVSKPNKEVSCSSGSNSIEEETCTVKNDIEHLTDIYPIRFHDGIAEPATAAARYVLKNAK